MFFADWEKLRKQFTTTNARDTRPFPTTSVEPKISRNALIRALMLEVAESGQKCLTRAKPPCPLVRILPHRSELYIVSPCVEFEREYMY